MRENTMTIYGRLIKSIYLTKCLYRRKDVSVEK